MNSGFKLSMVVGLSAIFMSACNGPAATPSESEKSSEQPVSGSTSVQVDKKNEQKLEVPGRREGNELTHATEVYGPTFVREGSYYIDLKIVPWSSYWYPFAEDYLYRGDSSPLRKYDLYFAATKSAPSHAALAEEKVHAEREFVAWAGRCNAWAIASVMEPEPYLAQPVTLNGITFSTADLKALLVMSYDRVEGISQFGQRNNGDEKSIAEDIYPDQFHQVIMKELFEKRRPIIMDKDLGIEVWNVPVYKAEVNLLRDQANPFLIHVNAALVGAAPLDPGTDPNGRVSKNVIYSYTYDLYGYPQVDGSIKVEYGLWTGDSIKSHPDFLWTLPEEKKRKSMNTELKTEIVDEIIKQAKQTRPSSLFF
jgi:hypothetical protein